VRQLGETASQNTPVQWSHNSLGEPIGETATLGYPPPTKSVIYAALGLPPRGPPSDFPDTPQGACGRGRCWPNLQERFASTGRASIRVAKLGNASPGDPPPTKSVIYAALGLPPPGDPLDFPDTPQGACGRGRC
jgi:hypothetical protein